MPKLLAFVFVFLACLSRSFAESNSTENVIENTLMTDNSTEVSADANITHYVYGNRYPILKYCIYLNWKRELYCSDPPHYLLKFAVKLEDESEIAEDSDVEAGIDKITFRGLNLPNLTNDLFFQSMEEGEGDDLETTVFSRTNTTFIEPGFFDDSGFQNLEISFNKLRTITTEVLTENLGQTLRSLNLKANNLTISLEAFKNLGQLETLILTFNANLLKDPNDIFPVSLRKLRTLTLDNCGISYINDHMFDNLKLLDELSLSFNPITSIPRAISGLPNLHKLQLRNTSVSSVYQDFYVKNDNLEYLSLSSSILKTIGDCGFCNFPRLKTIFMSYSPILSFIHENAFGRVSSDQPLKIKEFSIVGCNISTIPEKLLNWDLATNLHLRHNPYACDCSMAWLIEDLRQNFSSNHGHKLRTSILYSSKLKHHFSLKCASPREFANRTFETLPEFQCAKSEDQAFRLPAIIIVLVVFTMILASLGAVGYWLYKKGVIPLSHCRSLGIPSAGMKKLEEEFDGELDF